MHDSTGATTLSRFFSPLALRLGIAGLLLGTGPLILIIIFDPRSNPIGPGLLAFFTFWPSVILTVIGLMQGSARAARHDEARRHTGAHTEHELRRRDAA